MISVSKISQAEVSLLKTSCQEVCPAFEPLVFDDFVTRVRIGKNLQGLAAKRLKRTQGRGSECFGVADNIAR